MENVFPHPCILHFTLSIFHLPVAFAAGFDNGSQELFQLGTVGEHGFGSNSQVCHSERSVSGVEESTHLWNLCSQIGAKILRLALLAQDDTND